MLWGGGAGEAEEEGRLEQKAPQRNKDTFIYTEVSSGRERGLGCIAGPWHGGPSLCPGRKKTAGLLF